MRVRVVGGPWPERIGLEGVTVDAPPGPPVYPWAGRGKSEVVVLLAGDPYRRPGQHVWSCVMRRRDLEELP